MPAQPDAFAARADRVLDAAGELLLRHGYRKVTIEDVARRAKIGKGTVYLHWRTKDELFVALLARESLRLIDDMASRLRADPEEALPHRLMRTTYLAALRRPLLLAVLNGDTEVLGRLAETEINQPGVAAAAEFMEILTDYGLLRDDVPVPAYTLRAATAGFYVVDGAQLGEQLPPGTDLGAEERADALAFVVRATFEPARAPRRAVLSGAAAALVKVFDDIVPPYRAWIYEQDPDRPRLPDRKKDTE